MVSKKHLAIIVPGLGDETRWISLFTQHWTSYGLTPYIHAVRWRDGEDFLKKLDRLTNIIDEFSTESHLVSLIGISAGASAVLNAFVARRKKIHRVVTVCGRLRKGPTTGFRSFAAKTRSSPAFAQSVILFEKQESALDVADRKKILTIHPQFGDELVPPETVTIKGASNITIPTSEHLMSIGLALTVYSGCITSFLKTNLSPHS